MFFHAKDSHRRLQNHLRRAVVILTLLSLLLLAACGSSEPTPTPIPAAPADTPAATDVLAPTAATEPTAVAAPISPLQPAQAESPLDTSTAAAQAESPLDTPTGESPTATSELGLAAFVRDGVLYIESGPDDEEIVAFDDCSAGNCFIYHLDWSPSSDHLIYYIGSYDGSTPHQIRLANATGTTQTVTEQAAYVQSAGWSWDGSSIVYRTDTERYAEVTDGPAMRIQELWTVVVGNDGALGEPELQGEVTFGEGCGGGGRSESANVYEREGGFAYGYLSGVIAWTPSDILLYTDNCTTRGVSRFDLANDEPLEPYAGELRSLSLNGEGDAWVAIDSENQIVSGTPDGLETIVIPSREAPELVFYGKVTGAIYYTTLQNTGATDLVEQASATLDESILVYPYFDTTAASLIMLDQSTGEETELYADDGYAYARIDETLEGNVIFSRVEDNSKLQAAVENEELTADNWREALPTADVLLVTPGKQPVAVIADAQQYTPAH